MDRIESKLEEVSARQVFLIDELKKIKTDLTAFSQHCMGTLGDISDVLLAPKQFDSEEEDYVDSFGEFLDDDNEEDADSAYDSGEPTLA